jgi:hypothetical protein
MSRACPRRQPCAPIDPSQRPLPATYPIPSWRPPALRSLQPHPHTMPARPHQLVVRARCPGAQRARRPRRLGPRSRAAVEQPGRRGHGRRQAVVRVARHHVRVAHHLRLASHKLQPARTPGQRPRQRRWRAASERSAASQGRLRVAHGAPPAGACDVHARLRSSPATHAGAAPARIPPAPLPLRAAVRPRPPCVPARRLTCTCPPSR